MGIVRTLIRLPRKIKRLPRKLKRAPRRMLRVPKLFVRAVVTLWEWIVAAAQPFKFLPLDTFAGKALATTEIHVFFNLVVGLLYAIGVWFEVSIFLTVFEVVFPEVLIGALTAGAIFAVGYPLDQAGLIEAALVKAGIRQYNRTSAGLVALIVGLFVVIPVTYMLGDGVFLYWLGVVELDIVGMALFFALMFALVVGTVYWILQYNTESYYIRSVLSVVEVTEQPDETIGIVIRNDSDERVSLSQAEIEDSLGEGYALDNDNVSLRPGEKRQLDLPEEFKLEPTEYEVPTGLGMFYDERRHAKIYARSGDIFVLEWSE